MKMKLHSKRWKQILFFFMMIAIAYFLTIDISYARGVNSPEFQEKWQALMAEYRVILAGIAGFGAMTSLLVFIYHFMHLGAVSSNPAQRSQVVRNILISAICTSLLGGVTLFLTLFYSIMWA